MASSGTLSIEYHPATTAAAMNRKTAIRLRAESSMIRLIMLYSRRARRRAQLALGGKLGVEGVGNGVERDALHRIPSGHHRCRDEQEDGDPVARGELNDSVDHALLPRRPPPRSTGSPRSPACRSGGEWRRAGRSRSNTIRPPPPPR